MRGEKCMFSHPTAEIMSMEMAKQVGGTKVLYPVVRSIVTRMIGRA